MHMIRPNPRRDNLITLVSAEFVANSCEDGRTSECQRLRRCLVWRGVGPAVPRREPNQRLRQVAVGIGDGFGRRSILCPEIGQTIMMARGSLADSPKSASGIRILLRRRHSFPPAHPPILQQDRRDDYCRRHHDDDEESAVPERKGSDPRLRRRYGDDDASGVGLARSVPYRACSREGAPLRIRVCDLTA